MSSFQMILLFPHDPRILWGGLFPFYILSAFFGDAASGLFFCSSGVSSLTLDELDPIPHLCKSRAKMTTRVNINKTICLAAVPPLPPWTHQTKIFDHQTLESKYCQNQNCEQQEGNMSLDYHTFLEDYLSTLNHNGSYDDLYLCVLSLPYAWLYMCYDSICSMFLLIVTLYPSTIVLDLSLIALSSLKSWRIHGQYPLNKLP